MVSRINAGRLGLMLCLAIPLLGTGAAAVEGKKAKGEFGMVVGSLGGMTVEATSKDTDGRGTDVETGAGFAAGIFFEQKLVGPVWAGMSIDYYEIKGRRQSHFDENPRTLGLALRFSGRLKSQSGAWTFRPGVASGVTLLGEIGYLKTSQHVTIKPFIETVYRLSPKVGLVVELGIFSTVWGGNDDYDIKAGPTSLLRIGIVM